VNSPQTQDILKNINSFVTGFGLLDIGLIILLLVGLLRGYRKGFGGVFNGVIQLLFVMTLTLEYYEAVVAFFSVKSVILLFVFRVASFLLITIVSYFISKTILDGLAKIFTIRFTDIIDKVLGALFGGFFFILFLSFVCSLILLVPGDWFQENAQKYNLSGPFLIRLAPEIHKITRQAIPAPLQAHVQSTVPAKPKK